jgi:hypothetical protein
LSKGSVVDLVVEIHIEGTRVQTTTMIHTHKQKASLVSQGTNMEEDDGIRRNLRHEARDKVVSLLGVLNVLWTECILSLQMTPSVDVLMPHVVVTQTTEHSHS